MKVHFVCPHTMKVMHPNEEEAKKARKKMLKRHPKEQVKVFLCLHCGQYHIGRKKRKPKTIVKVEGKQSK